MDNTLEFRGIYVTYQYSDIDPLEALYNRAREYGIDKLAFALGARMGKQVSPAVLRNKLRPEIRSHFLTVEEFSLITELCEGRGDPAAKLPLRALCWQHGMLAVDLPDAEGAPEEVLTQLAILAREFSELVQEVTAATVDRRITAKECARIQKELEQVQYAAMKLGRSAQAAVEPEGFQAAAGRSVEARIA